MKKEEFLVELEDILQREEPCNEADILEEYDEWDSLSKMAVMAFYSKNEQLFELWHDENDNYKPIAKITFEISNR